MSIATDLTRIETAKSNIKTSIQNKGVTVPTTTKIDGYSALIDKITDLKGETKTLYPTGSDQTITPSTGKNGITSISLKKVTTANLSAANIANGVTVKVGRADDDDAIASVTGTAVLLAGEERSVTLNSSSASYTPSSGKNGITKITVTASSGTMTVKGTTPSMSGAWTEDYDAQGHNAYVVTATAPAPTSVTATAGWVTSVTRNTGTSGTFVVPTGSITNNTSGGTSTATINRGSQIKIGAGYYPSDKYYTAQSNSGTKTITGSGTTSVDGYANASVAAGSASATGKASTVTQGTASVSDAGVVTIPYTTNAPAPTTSVGTAGWITSVSANAGTGGSGNLSYTLPSTWKNVKNGNLQITSQGSSTSPVDVTTYSGAYVKSGTMTVTGGTPSMSGAWEEDYDAKGSNAYIVRAAANTPTAGTATAGWVSSVTRNAGGATLFAVPTGAVSGGGLSGGGSLSGSKEFSPSASASASGNGITLTSTTNPSGYYISVTGGSAAIASTTILSGSKSVTRAAITKTAGYVQAGTYAAEDSKSVSASATASVKASSTTVYYTLATETKTVTPTTSAQDVTPTSNKLLSKVTVNAIPSEYIVPSGNLQITSQGSSTSPVNVTAYSGAYVKSGTMTVTAATPSMSAAITEVSGVNKYRVTATAPAPTSVTATAGWVSSVTRNAGTSGTYDIPLATFDVSGNEVGCMSAGYVVEGKVGSVAAGSATGNAGTITYKSHTQDSSNKKKFTITGTVTAPAPTVSAGYVSSGTAGTSSDKTVSVTITDAQAQAAVGSGSATTPATTITANPSLSSTFTTGSGYKMSVSTTKSVTPTVSAGYVSSGTAGTITVSGEAYVAQNSFASGTAPSGTTPTSLSKNTVYKLSAGYYPSDRYYKTQADPSLSGNAGVANVLSGKTFYSNSYTQQTGTMTDNGAITTSIGYDGSYTIPAGYHNGSGKVTCSVSAGTITNNTSGGTSSGTINRGSQIKIGAGYYSSDKYYTAQSNSGTKTITASGTTSVDGYANVSVAAGTMTVKGTTPSMSAAITEVSGVNKYRVTATAPAPTSVTATAGWVTSVTRNAGTSGTYDIPLATFGVSDDEVGCMSAGYVVEGKVGSVSAGTITNNTSGGTSTATINRGKQIKIGKGYYSSDKYYTAQSNSGTKTITGSGTTSVDGYANASVPVAEFAVDGFEVECTDSGWVDGATLVGKVKAIGSAVWTMGSSPLTSGFQNYVTAGKVYIVDPGAGGFQIGSSIVSTKATIYVRSKTSSAATVYCYRHGNYSNVLSGTFSNYELYGGIYLVS